MDIDFEGRQSSNYFFLLKCLAAAATGYIVATALKMSISTAAQTMLVSTTVTLLPVTIFLIASIFMARTTMAQSWSLTGNSNAATGSKLGTTSLTPLKIFTNNLERIRIDASGNVGIGTLNPLNILTVQLNGSIPAASWLATFARSRAGPRRRWQSPP